MEDLPSLSPIFVDIDPENPVMEITSLCMQCGQDGLTRILLTKIPHFKEIVIMAFECEACGFKNSEVQSAGEIQERGKKVKSQIEDW